MSAKQCKVVLALGQVASLLCYCTLLSLFPTQYVELGETISSGINTSYCNQISFTMLLFVLSFAVSIGVFSKSSSIDMLAS